jgi:RND family efflux transporter MFP subunit
MKRLSLALAVIAVLAGLGGAAWFMNVGALAQQEEAGAPPTEVAVAVPLQVVQAGDRLAARSFIGRVEPQKTVDIAFQVAGQILEIGPTEGQRVARHSMIAALDDEDFRLALARAEAVVDLARSDEARVSELVERKVSPQAQLDRARAELRQAEVAVAEARRALEQTRVEAPFEAIVARRLIETYSNVTPAVPVLRLQDVSTLMVAISLPEDLAVFARSSPEDYDAVARFPALPGAVVSLDLARFVTEADPVAQTYGVKFALRDPDPRVLPGMTATVEIRPRRRVEAVMVPVSAVDTSSGASPRVWVVDAENRARPKDVSLGLPQGDQIPVLSGVTPGARVVAAGWWQMRDGVLVRPAML